MKEKGESITRNYGNLYNYHDPYFFMYRTAEAFVDLRYLLTKIKPIQSKKNFLVKTGLVDISARSERLKYGSHKMRPFLGL